MQILAYLLARFSEPSSYAGLGAVVALVGFHFSDTLTGQLAQFLAAGCALAALFLKERGVIHGAALAIGLAGALGLAACQEVADTAKTIDPKLTAACDAALTLASFAGPYAVWIEAACGTAEAIAKLAENPTSLAWLQQLIADAEKLHAGK
jgi:hypothetical protein